VALNRRDLLVGGAALAGAALAAPLGPLLAPSRAAPSRADYGELFPARDRTTGLVLLYLPRGFKCWSFGWTGDPLEGGGATPSNHDGMAVVGQAGSALILVRNHELRRYDGVFAKGAPSYDAGGGGGCVTLHFDVRRRELVRAYASLTGTVTNCAGGPTPWGSWLTCEEDVNGSDTGVATLAQRHGYAFEVPASGGASAQPLAALGRFVHEAAAVDPATGDVYETEDERIVRIGPTLVRGAGFYRFVPNERGRLAKGGALSMLAVAGEPQKDLSGPFEAGTRFLVEWVDVADPDPDFGDPDPFGQAFAAGGAAFHRLEGCWYAAGRIWFASTTGGRAARGQLWCYDPAASELALAFESPHAGVLDSPDNLAASPRGGLLLCEDGSDGSFLHGMTPDGEIFRFAQNRVLLDGERNGLEGDYTGSEFAGATFSPDGKWLFVNLQEPGISFAITGPWSKGAL
jgi:hypothetical protein